MSGLRVDIESGRLVCNEGQRVGLTALIIKVINHAIYY